MNTRIANICVCCGGTNLKSSPAVLMPFISDRVFNWKPTEIDDSWGLKTIKNGMAYSLCNTLQCRDCNHLFLDIRFDDQEMENLYKGYREDSYVELRDHYEPGYKEKNNSLGHGYNYVKDIEDFLRPFTVARPGILDWGGDTGKNTPFRQNCESLDIYDISKVDVVPGARQVNLEEAQSKKYDLIICSNVLEHIPYPSTILDSIKQSMDKDTVLYIEAPYEDLVRKEEYLEGLYLKKRHWHEHINFFNDDSFLGLLDNNGFEVKKLSKLSISGETSDFVFQIAATLK